MNHEMLVKLDELAEDVYHGAISSHTNDRVDIDDHNEMVEAITEGMIKAIEYYKQHEHNNNATTS